MLNSPNWFSRLIGVPYNPRPDERPFLERLTSQESGGVTVSVAVLDDRESERYFGVRMARKGIQPVWLEVANRSRHSYRLRLASIDPSYFPPLEAAYICHFRLTRRILEFGAIALLFIHVLLLLPFKLWGAHRANRLMDAFFQEQGIGWGIVRPGESISGFVFTTLAEGTKRFTVKLISRDDALSFDFAVPVPGLHIDHRNKELDAALADSSAIDCDEATLRDHLTNLPPATTNATGARTGDPLNLVIVGQFDDVMASFGASWDETEAITLASCWRTFKAFTLGRPYPYSPVSSLYHDGRSQDFALQRARETINERLHLRLWLSPWRLAGRPVWVGQISRDIGVRFTWRTWNLTTHKIDPDVDDARDYVLDYLLESGRVERVGYVGGVGSVERSHPRHNLTGDPYFTDGLRAVAVVSGSRTSPGFLNWV